MFLHSRDVVDPDGNDWRVSVDWHRWHFRSVRDGFDEDHGSSWWHEMSIFNSADSLLGGLVLVVIGLIVGVLFSLLIWPLLLLALEVVVGAVVVLFAVLARVVFGRPWRVEVDAVGGHHASRRVFRVRGVRATTRLIEDFADCSFNGEDLDSVVAFEEVVD